MKLHLFISDICFQMYSFSGILLLSLLAGCASGRPALEEVYQDVVSAVSPGEQHLSRAALQSVFNTLEKRVQCGQASCEKCSPADAIHQLINFDQQNLSGPSLVISVPEFGAVVVGSVLYLGSPGLACSAIKQGTWREETEHFLHEITHNEHHRHEQEQHERIDVYGVEAVLRSVLDHYRPLESQGCVGAGDLVPEVSGSSGHEDQEVRAVLGRVLYHALKGHCFVSPSLPEESFFLDYILERLGSDNFTIYELKLLMQSLKLGPNFVTHEHDHSEHDHDEHDHSEHDHDEHDHSEHDHDEHDHSDHDHDEHDHSDHDHDEHDHSDHDHDEHDHSDHDHDEHDHSKHDHDEHDHDEHSHDEHDHSKHGHDEHDHSKHGHDEHDHSKHGHDEHDHSKHGQSDTRTKRSFQQRKGLRTNSTWDERCFSAEELVQIYSRTNSSSPESGQSHLARLSPALVQQVLSGACTRVTDPVKSDGLSETERYVYATLANVMITLLSMFGIVVLLCTSCSTVFQLCIQFCVSLAVGSLTGDALLHLMPMILGLHVHAEESGHDPEHVHSEGGPPDYFFKMLVLMSGIYFFYLMETLFSLISYKNKTHQYDLGDAFEPHHCHNGPVLEMYQHEMKQKVKLQSVSRSDLVCSEDEKPKKECTQDHRLLPYMITIGDGIHNFADGLAMGAAFSVSWKSGLATSVAVMCHELPHELGDFAILLHCGLSVRRALLLNVGSAMTSFFGLYTALSVATDVVTQQWIAAVTAGLFLYVGLVDMLPTLVHIDSKRPWTMFLLQNVGLLTGWGFMFVLSIFEEKISF